MYGMTEEQFWNSNPRIIKVWEKTYKNEMNRKNAIVHAWIGNYGLSALVYAIDHCFNGNKAKSKYIEKPIRLFELDEEEKKIESQKARNLFIAWAGMAEKKYKKGGEVIGGHDD